MRAFVTIGRLPLLVLALALLPALACAQLAIDKRIALVVGNWQYAQSPLKNPQNDLADMATLLKQRLKFDEVIVQSNADPQKLKAAIRSFGDALANAAAKAPSRVLGLFYYTGHGVQSEGKNYLVPVGKRFESEDDIEADAVQVQFVLDRMRRAGGGLNVVVLDACRDFPLRRRAKSDTRGLARMQPPQGSLIAYATEADATAYDNPDERNGLFTKHLLQRLAQADQDLDKAFDQVSTDVYRDAKARNRRQVPEIMKKTWPPEPVYLAGSKGAGSETRNLDAQIARQASLLAQTQRETAAWAHQQERTASGADLSPGKVFRDCADCPEMVVIPAGAFTMGSPEGEAGRSKDEGPQHKVKIGTPFATGKYEITFGEWNACVTAGGCKHKPDDLGWGHTRQPVINVSWNDAQEYVAWLAKKTGKRYRLLTEAEWEYVARAGSTSAYPWGNEPGTNKANSWGSGSRWSGKQTAPVGSFQPNAFGMYDTIGNVWEWVQDCSHDTYSGGAPTDGSAWESGKCEARVLRGGSWHVRPQDTRAANRLGLTPSGRVGSLGFRLARTLP